jgi:hypothetical protein
VVHSSELPLLLLMACQLALLLLPSQRHLLLLLLHQA